MNAFARAVPALLLLLLSHPIDACTKPHGMESLTKAEVVVLGEYHGTREIPSFFFDTVCSMSNESEGVIVVGLELPDSFNAVFRMIGSADPNKLNAEIRKNSFWRNYGDGRHSRAMLELVENLISLASKRERMKLVAFAEKDTDGAGADILAQAMREYSADKTLVLVGNAHARLLPMKGSSRSPFAEGLSKRHGYDVLSLDISAAGGEAWVCLSSAPPPSPPKCAARPVLAKRQTAGIHLNGCTSECAWHGTYHIDKLSVAPAVDDE